MLVLLPVLFVTSSEPLALPGWYILSPVNEGASSGVMQQVLFLVQDHIPPSR